MGKVIDFLKKKKEFSEEKKKQSYNKALKSLLEKAKLLDWTKDEDKNKDDS